MSDEINIKPDGWVIQYGKLLVAIDEKSPDFAWDNAIQLSQMSEHVMIGLGFKCRPVKIAFLDEGEK